MQFVFKRKQGDCGVLTECPSGIARGRMAVLRSEGLRLSLGKQQHSVAAFASLNRVRRFHRQGNRSVRSVFVLHSRGLNSFRVRRFEQFTGFSPKGAKER